ncbi:MAG TPA: glycosyltransferase family 9 protein [Candidatus Baltobacteraceae bacterium]|jgi:ADP-heptose:LPS heptosyltransferase|nr:glycosyltransferase family 9 protein [Candidatus Baltobacteraceae bacterium]
MQKLILNCRFTVGDVVMLTAAVRDLHHWYPGRFVTDVRTRCPDLWENNPHVTTLSDDDPEATKIECTYPLIDQSNETPYHCLHGFVEFFNQRLGLNIKPTAFKGDIHLSNQEKAWHSQVHEVTGAATPFWIVAAGGKYDLTIKWWQSKRYQEVVDHFRGKIQFVQVGERGHYHPKLDGVIDLRGQTTLRELVRLVHHSQGVLCSITALMHLAAAVETKRGQPPNRPCVVVAGGREPTHWEAYPHHQFIHTIGALPCCAHGGCWRDRTTRLRDGDKKDRPENLCVDVVRGLPHCMDLITPQEVVRRIEGYFNGGVVKYLSPRQRQAGARGISATSQNDFHQHRLSLSGAGMACERFIETIPSYPDSYEGRGIVVCGGGARYFASAWVCINMLRRVGCSLPIQLWYLGRKEMDSRMKALVAPLGVECVDATKVRRKFPARILQGWELKPYALLHSPYREVLLMDADNVAVMNPEFLFDTPEFRDTGAIFWPDFIRGTGKKARTIWRSFGMRIPDELEFESGQIVLNKERCWRALCLTHWINDNSDFYYRHMHGDKETFHVAFRKLKAPYSLIQKPIDPVPGVMCQHDFLGRRIFQHRNMEKWDLFFNKRIKGLRWEKRCHAYISELRRAWDGRIQSDAQWKGLTESRRVKGAIRFQAVMISCRERDELRRRTLENLAKTDWGDMPLHVHFDTPDDGTEEQRQVQSSFLALQKSLDCRADYILFLEDDLDFNRHIRHNLSHWSPIRRGVVTLAGLYNPRLSVKACDLRSNARIIDPNTSFGSQALLLSKETAAYVVRRWNDVLGLQDTKICRLGGRLGKPVYYHAPSLVQHIGSSSTWGGGFHQAFDFDPVWKA